MFRTFQLLTITLVAGFIVTSIAQGETRTWCDPYLGCLNITEDWYYPTRPLNPLPDTREDINTKFKLSTREDRGIETEVILNGENVATISTSTYDPTKQTKFIIHGFVDNANSPPVIDMVNAMLDYGDYNVIRTGWNSRTGYFQAASNTRVVGLEIGKLVNVFIDTYGQGASDVHLIGHSLGSHISGYAGEQIEGLGRISGLDPAGPYFTNTDTFVRLDPSDALFVDNYHTDCDPIYSVDTGYGTAQPMGHLDFYPNGGYVQPGCGGLGIWDWIFGGGSGDNGVRDIVACEHFRAVSFYKESFERGTCQFLAHECTNEEDYYNGLCVSCGNDNEYCAYAGIRADEYSNKERELVIMYYQTSDKPPFCLNTYNVEILLAPPGDAGIVIGNIELTLYGLNGNISPTEVITDGNQEFHHGTVVKLFYNTQTEIDDILRADIRWESTDNTDLYVQTLYISPASVYPEEERESKTFTGCTNAVDPTEIPSRETYAFFKNYGCQLP